MLYTVAGSIIILLGVAFIVILHFPRERTLNGRTAKQWLDPSKRRSKKRRFLSLMVRAMYVSVILAMCDICSLSFGHNNKFFSATSFRTSNDDSMYIGFGYCILNHRDVYRDGARTYGPEVYFLFPPVGIDAAHGGVRVHWLWSRR